MTSRILASRRTGPFAWAHLALASLVLATVAPVGPVHAADDPAALLTAALDGGADTRTRLDALERLSKQRDVLGPLVPRIATRLDDPNDDIRYRAGYVLYHAGDAGAVAVPALVRTLGAASDVVRTEAVSALGHLGPLARDAVTPLRTLARFDPVADVRREAAQALTFIDPALAAEPIDGLLARLDGREPLERMSTLVVLKNRAADLRPLAPRVRALAQTDLDADVRGSAWRTAAALDPATPAPPPETLERLEQCFDPEPATRELAVTALVHGTPRSTPSRSRACSSTRSPRSGVGPRAASKPPCPRRNTSRPTSRCVSPSNATRRSAGRWSRRVNVSSPPPTRSRRRPTAAPSARPPRTPRPPR